MLYFDNKQGNTMFKELRIAWTKFRHRDRLAEQLEIYRKVVDLDHVCYLARVTDWLGEEKWLPIVGYDHKYVYLQNTSRYVSYHQFHEVFEVKPRFENDEERIADWEKCQAGNEKFRKYQQYHCFVEADHDWVSVEDIMSGHANSLRIFSRSLGHGTIARSGLRCVRFFTKIGSTHSIYFAHELTIGTTEPKENEHLSIF